LELVVRGAGTLVEHFAVETADGMSNARFVALDRAPKLGRRAFC
jgi:hypothetical protein